MRSELQLLEEETGGEVKRGEESRHPSYTHTHDSTKRHTSAAVTCRLVRVWQPELGSEISADNNLDVQIAELFVMFVSEPYMSSKKSSQNRFKLKARK